MRKERLAPGYLDSTITSKRSTKGSDDRVGSPILIIGRGKQAIFFVDDHLIEIFPVPSVYPVEDHTLFGFWKTVDLVDDLRGDLGEVGPDHILFASVQFSQIRSAHNLFFGLFRMTGNFTCPRRRPEEIDRSKNRQIPQKSSCPAQVPR